MPKTPFERVVDDFTDGCGCACHVGTGHRSSCKHCLSLRSWAGISISNSKTGLLLGDSWASHD